jgi:predicted Zn-dependent protease
LGAALRRADAPADEVKAALARALALAPRHADAHVLLARIDSEEGKPRDAVTHLRVALESLPHDPKVRAELALALDESGERDLAVSEYRGLIADRPSDISPYLRLAELYERMGRDYDAEDVLEALVAAVPSSPLGWVRLAQLYERRDETAKATRASAEARKLGAEVEPDHAIDTKTRPLPKSPH